MSGNMSSAEGGSQKSMGVFGMLTSLAQKGLNVVVGKDVEVINPEGGKDDALQEAEKGRFKKEESDTYWKMMQKYIGADVTSMVTLPVVIFEPMTMLQRMAELMEYSDLLNKADMCEDPYLKLVYASSWAVSVYWAYQRTWKPFNPILGETFEMVNHNNMFFLAEQVTHHPPQSAGHAENEHFSYDVTSKLRTKFLGNSVEIYPVGRTRVVLKRTGEVLDLVPPPSVVHNLIFGRPWVDSPGDMVMTNLTTGDKVVLFFQPCSWFGAGRYEVDGYVYDAAEEPKILISGKFNTSMSWQPCDTEGEPLPDTNLEEVWKLNPLPANDKFSYTDFAHKINSFDTSPTGLLPSDSRLRTDRRYLADGDLSKSGAEKSRLEEKQRAEKRMREAKKVPWAPRWFKQTGEVSETPWGPLELYEFTSSYREHREQVESGSSAASGDDRTKVEFDPWQFRDEAASGGKPSKPEVNGASNVEDGL